MLMSNPPEYCCDRIVNFPIYFANDRHPPENPFVVESSFIIRSSRPCPPLRIPISRSELSVFTPPALLIATLTSRPWRHGQNVCPTDKQSRLEVPTPRAHCVN